MKVPKWQETVQDLYKGQISNSFMLTGNIGDYAYETTCLKDYLIGFILDKKRNNHFNIDDVYVFNIHDGGVSVPKWQVRQCQL